MSSISIIGTGNMASALAGRALAGGNAVEIIGRDPVKAEELAGRARRRHGWDGGCRPGRGHRHPRRAVRQCGGGD